MLPPRFEPVNWNKLRSDFNTNIFFKAFQLILWFYDNDLPQFVF